MCVVIKVSCFIVILMHTSLHYTVCINSFPVVSLTASINVVSASMRTFQVNCTSTGGRALNMSVSGSSGMVTTTDIVSLGSPQRRGNDSFSTATNTITGGIDGDTYHCTASNGVSVPPTNTATLRGNYVAVSVHYLKKYTGHWVEKLIMMIYH